MNPNIDDDTRARAMKFVADKATPAAKQRVVSKKELEASGLSLRDFLNKERGLTRRKDKDPTAGEAKDHAAQQAADAVDPGDDGGLSVVRRQNAENRSAVRLRDAQTPPTIRTSAENKDVSDMAYKKGGKVKGKMPVKFASGGKASSASKRADGIATKGKTKGRMV